MSSASPTPFSKPARPSDDWLSAAVDGDADALDRACQALRDGDEAIGRRACDDWHAYHLIGDVLRSSDLASSPRHDAAFLAAFRERLAAEPVVVAPVVPPVAPRPVRWRVPVAAAAGMAGIAVVAGVLVMSRSGGEGGAAGAVPLAAVPRVAPEAPGGPATLVRDGYIRDARIEEFMRVHQGAGGGLTLVPQGVRQVDVIVAPVPQR